MKKQNNFLSARSLHVWIKINIHTSIFYLQNREYNDFDTFSEVEAKKTMLWTLNTHLSLPN